MRQLTAYELNLLLRAGRELSSAELAGLGVKPIEYVCKLAIFCGREFFVDERVLIPRIETERLVGLTVDFIEKLERDTTSALKLVEVGTGSGALGLTIGLELARLGVAAEIQLLDNEDAALAVAKVNYSRYEDRLGGNVKVQVYKSDLLETVTNSDKFDVIVANLPYIPSGRRADLPSAVRDYEPASALFAGADGFADYARLLVQARELLKPDGLLALEVDDTHDELFLKKLPTEITRGWTIRILRDEANRNRYWLLTF